MSLYTLSQFNDSTSGLYREGQGVGAIKALAGRTLANAIFDPGTIASVWRQAQEYVAFSSPFSIPASSGTTAVAIPANVDYLQPGTNCFGSINSVAGTLARELNGVYRFSRAVTAGASTGVFTDDRFYPGIAGLKADVSYVELKYTQALTYTDTQISVLNAQVVAALNLKYDKVGGPISGNVTIGGTLGVTGATTLTSLSTSGNTSVGGTLGVTGAASFSSTLDAVGNLSVATNKLTVAAASGNTTIAGTLALAGAFIGASTGTFAGTLGVTGATTLSSTLGVTGVATFSSSVAVTSRVSCADAVANNEAITLGQLTSILAAGLANVAYTNLTNTFTPNQIIVGGLRTGDITIKSATPTINFNFGDSLTTNVQLVNSASNVLTLQAITGTATLGLRSLSAIDDSGTTVGTDGQYLIKTATGMQWNTLVTYTDRIISGSNTAIISNSGLVLTFGSNITTFASNGDLTIPGDLVVDGDIQANFLSDSRLKTKLVPLQDSVSKLATLDTVKYNWTGELDKDESTREYGVIAQQVQEVFPELVTTRSNGYLAVKYQQLIPVLIAAIKELNSKVEELQHDIANIR